MLETDLLLINRHRPVNDDNNGLSINPGINPARLMKQVSWQLHAL